MSSFHVALGFNPSNPNPPNPNPNNWYGSLQFGYCIWTGASCASPVVGSLPTALNFDSLTFNVYQLAGSTKSPAPSTTMPTGQAIPQWITATPVSPTPSSATAFYASMSTIQGLTLTQFGTTQVNSAVFAPTYTGPFWAWMITAPSNTNCPYECIADNPNGPDGAVETFSFVFQINVNGNVYGHDPNMIIKP